jgi:TonB family protein
MVVGLVLAAAAVVQATAPVITPPRQLTRIDVSRFYPPAALDAGMEGLTRLGCTLTITGRLERCSVSGSSGFPVLDEAAFRIAEAHRYDPQTVDGVAQEIPVILPVRWKIAE